MAENLRRNQRINIYAVTYSASIRLWPGYCVMRFTGSNATAAVLLLRSESRNQLAQQAKLLTASAAFAPGEANRAIAAVLQGI